MAERLSRQQLGFLAKSMTRNMSGSISFDELKSLMQPSISTGSLTLAEEACLIEEMNRLHTLSLNKAGVMIWQLNATIEVQAAFSPAKTNMESGTMTHTTEKTEKKASNRMISFVGVIFAVAVVLCAAYLFIGKPGKPEGQNIAPPSGESNQPVR